jgi:hypothetical protein
MENQETDTALILENELKRRVKEVLGTVVHQVVAKKFDELFAERQNQMLMEISIKVGQMLRGIEEDKRSPLWEQPPKFFEDKSHAVREQTPPV